ncbi:carbohydrate ABC transporter permease [Cohnella sp. LGH]|uniref:Multiple sugar transport system permease protein/putative aldouronate transport system permease protein n=1 Tax=Cohnella phaseoli TaxID=456490 RepID=A0A3D9HYN0_9BACL|nr:MULTISPECIES: carbohydrate ABC transporter permease [Cohnella]QTH44417.1 carbohydrate ABC transporter permease [Cohnella sp. LGH]RED54535.1 multiple sugar transport system permease protein/putative aldouronate transport system permease protein [Cohnella phaseoli]
MNRLSIGDRTMMLVFYVSIGLFSILCVLPMWIALMASFTNELELIRSGYGLWVRSFDLTAYKLIFTGTGSVYRAYGVTVLTTIAGVVLTVFLTSSFAYPLSVKSLKYRNRLSFFCYITMVFNGGLVPTYILTTRFLHLQDTLWVLIIPAALNGFNVFLMKNYFATLPEALAESAKIDGASEIYIYFKIILPLSMPILATIALFAAIGYWNEWFRVLLFINDKELFTLQFLIMRLQQQAEFLNSSLSASARAALGGQTIPTIGIRVATAMVSIGPIILLYPFLQKYFIKGLTIGAVKG